MKYRTDWGLMWKGTTLKTRNGTDLHEDLGLLDKDIMSRTFWDRQTHPLHTLGGHENGSLCGKRIGMYRIRRSSLEGVGKSDLQKMSVKGMCSNLK